MDRTNDTEVMEKLQQTLNRVAAGQARVDRAALGFVVVTVMPLGSPEVFACLEMLGYQYVALVGAPAHLFRKTI